MPGLRTLSTGTVLAMLVAPFAGSAAGPVPQQSAGAHAGTGAACTRHVANPRSLAAIQPGDVVCFSTVSKTSRLHITKSGTADKPITYSGKGQQVGGIDIDASYVVVDGYTMTKPSAPGIELHGDNVTVQNNTVTAPKGDDGDGLRFFGNNLIIQHNTISKTDNSTGAHADCMQTFATGDDDVASQHVLIDSNRCEQVDNMCLIGEGPNSEAGDGSGIGVSQDWTFSNNYCQTQQASQTLMIDDIQHLTVTGNTWAAGPDHAIGLQNHSTDAHVNDNKLDPSIKCEVGIDSSSKKGYQGPTPRCDP
ncbi:hypothetical protein GCM10009765_21540 [Fodinicola feengrottensis]|uniref:Right handed beta helix domain-containing protein n=1 Tax=Fodinicola feengrottensis TaxID=435914 RepID=A0ABN2GIJ1_9ACTN